MLLEHGVMVHHSAERMAEETVGVTDQVSVGTTSAGKLYVNGQPRLEHTPHSESFSSDGCTYAMKLDGGHTAHLHYPGINLGNPN